MPNPEARRLSQLRIRTTLSSFVILAVLVLVIAGAATFGYVFYIRHTVETELRGEVFIVTKGAQNIQLGLVEVVALPEERIAHFIEGKLGTINVEYSKYKSLEQGN
jgi:hypothetical protein